MPAVSVIMAAYNGERYIAETIESIQQQAMRDWELIVVDDGSVDGTGAIARAYASGDRRIRVVDQQNGGVARARNRGIAESNPSAPYITFLDQDDLWYPDTLAVLIATLENDPVAVGAHGLTDCIDGNGRRVETGFVESFRHRRSLNGGRVVAWPDAAPTTFAVLALRSALGTPGCALIRRRALTVIGGFDPAIAPGDDWDMFLRLTMYEYLAVIDRAVIQWRQHATNASNRSDVMLDVVDRVHRKLIATPGLAPWQRSLARRGYREFRRSSWRYRWEAARHYTRWATQNVRRGHLWLAATQLGHALIAAGLAATRLGRPVQFVL